MCFKEMNHKRTSEYVNGLLFLALAISYRNINLKISFFSFRLLELFLQLRVLKTLFCFQFY